MTLVGRRVLLRRRCPPLTWGSGPECGARTPLPGTGPSLSIRTRPSYLSGRPRLPWQPRASVYSAPSSLPGTKIHANPIPFPRVLFPAAIFFPTTNSILTPQPQQQEDFEEGVCIIHISTPPSRTTQAASLGFSRLSAVPELLHRGQVCPGTKSIMSTTTSHEYEILEKIGMDNEGPPHDPSVSLRNSISPSIIVAL